MSRVERLAQGQFNTFKKRLDAMVDEIEEEHKSAFMQGYATGETSRMFRDKQPSKRYMAELIKKNEKLEKQVSALTRALVLNSSEEQLAKAKELIRRLLTLCCAYGAAGKTTTEAKEFLKEISE